MKGFMMNLEFKGQRNYIHGSDIYNSISEELSELGYDYIKKLAFKSFARHQVRFTLDSAESTSAFAFGILSTAQDSQKFYLIETDEPVTDRYPYDEALITDKAVIAGSQITGKADNLYSVIENVIALTKQLNYQLSPDVSGKWLFGQLDLKMALPVEWRQIQISQKSCIANSFSRNLITIDGAAYGEIRFIVGEP